MSRISFNLARNILHALAAMVFAATCPGAGFARDGGHAPAARSDRLVNLHSRYIDAWSGQAQVPIAQFGPFLVIDRTRAMLVRETDTSAPRHFVRMMASFPTIRVLEFRDCPGTLDDNANLVLGRMIHERGLATDVPPGGSVRSGAVDLFLAGVRRTAAADATFAVHAWLDEDGLRPTSFAPDSPVNRKYVQFYREMGGMAPDAAAAFYDLTNSVPNEQALWLSVRDIARFAVIDIR
ncbi:hypothetical protein [Novosphingobium sp.]|uniref:hypothetical protein n=1 Tax=Novosphingobium sp. TaxID=1874826 RepID=UPI0038BC08AE